MYEKRKRKAVVEEGDSEVKEDKRKEREREREGRERFDLIFIHFVGPLASSLTLS